MVPLLFGSRTRTRFLLYLAGSAGSSIPEISRALQIDKAHIRAITRHFEKIGVISVDRASAQGHKVAINSESPVYREINTLLRQLAPPGIACRRRHGKPITNYDPLAQPGKLELLLGTRARTLTIAILSRLGSMTLVELANNTGAAYGSIRVVVAFLTTQHIVRCVQIGSSVHVSLDERSAGASELRALGRGLAKLIPLASAAKQSPPFLKHSKVMPPPMIDSPELLFPFGSLTQAKLLVALARVGSIRTADLADLVGYNQDQVRGIGESLERAGLVVRTSWKRPLRFDPQAAFEI